MLKGSLEVEEPSELPHTWEWSSVGDVCSVNERDPRLRTLPDDLQVSFVPMAAVDAKRGGISDPVDRPLAEVRKGFTPFADGDVIFARITPSMENGKAAIAGGLTNGLGFGSTEFHVMRPGERVLPEWVFHFVRQVAFRNEAKASFSGTAGQLRVPDSFVRSASLPLPPLPEQRRIVEKIERLLEQSQTARDALDRIPPLLKRFRQSVLAKAFRGELTERDPNDEPASVLLERIREERRRKWEDGLRAKGKDPRNAEYVEPEPPDAGGLPELPKEWIWTALGEVIELLQYGSSVKADAPHESGVPIIRMGNIQDGGFDLTSLKHVHEASEDIARYVLRRDDILINRTNSPELVGKSARWDLDGRFIFASYLIRLRADSRVTIPSYLLHVINAQTTIEHIARVRHQVAGQSNINSKDIRSIPVPLAPLAEQHEIVTKLERLLSMSSSIAQLVDRARHRAANADQAVLARAFRGEL